MGKLYKLERQFQENVDVRYSQNYFHSDIKLESTLKLQPSMTASVEEDVADEKNKTKESKKRKRNDRTLTSNQSSKCNHCGIVFSQNGSMMRHIQLKHEGVEYPCNQCNYQAFPAKKQFDKIFKYHTPHPPP